MAAKRDIAAQINSSFPGYERLIDLAYRDDPIFRELCDDYVRCAAALKRWQRSNGDESSPRIEEYSELLAELANEVEAWLDGMVDDSSRLSGNERSGPLGCSVRRQDRTRIAVLGANPAQ